MMKVVVTVVAALSLAAAGVLAYAATRPDTFRVARDTLVNASPSGIYPHISDFREWQAWSPYENRDPNMRRSFSGPAGGVGAAYAWEGDGNVGEGRMEVIEASAPNLLKLKLDFTRPFEAHNTVEFSLQPAGEATRVTWAMHGPVPYLAKVMHMFFNMDRMVGSDFEAGLAKLKDVAEKQKP